MPLFTVTTAVIFRHDMHLLLRKRLAARPRAKEGKSDKDRKGRFHCLLNIALSGSSVASALDDRTRRLTMMKPGSALMAI